MQEPKQPVAGCTGREDAARAASSSHNQQEQRLPAPGPLTVQVLQQLEHSSTGGHQMASAPHPSVPETAVSQTESNAASISQPLHQRSPLGRVASSLRKESSSSTCSSMALLGRMSGVSLARPDTITAVAEQQQQLAPALQQQARQGLDAPAAQQPSGCSTSSSPPQSPSRGGVQDAAPAGTDSSAAYPGVAYAAEGYISNMVMASSTLPVPPQALGLPAIATTLPVPIPGSGNQSAAGASPKGTCSPRPSVKSLSITPQASTALPTPNAASLAILAAAHMQQQQQQQQQVVLQAAASVGGAGFSVDESLDSSSDDDDNYEFGEQKIKRAFSIQQRRQRRQALFAQQQQQQAALLQQQQAQLLSLQQQQQQEAELQALLLQQAAAGGSPTSAAGVGSPAAALVAAAGGTAAVFSPGTGTSPLLAAVLGSSQPGTPRDTNSPSLGFGHIATTAGSTPAATVSAAAAMQPLDVQAQLQQLTSEQTAALAVLAAQQGQQQQQGVAPTGSLTAALQASPSIEWASAVPGAAAAAAVTAGGVAVAGPAGGSPEPSFVPVLEHTVSGTSVASAVSGMSNSKAAVSVPPGVGSAGGAATAGACLRGVGGAAAAVPGDVAGSVGSGRAQGLLGGGVVEAPVGSGPSFLARQQGTTGGLGLVGSGGGVMGGGGAGGGNGGVDDDGAKKDQSELKAEFQGLSLFNDEDDDDEAEGEEQRPPWYKRAMVWLHIVAFSLSVLLLLMGILTQYVEAMSSKNSAGVDLYRFFYFFMVWPTLWVTVSFLTDRLFGFVEWWFYREALFYLDNVRRTARGVVFMCLILPWFVVCFWEAWCADGQCQAEGTYKRATDVVWKLMVCLTLFSLANFLKSVLTKLLSSHFYRTAHFKKVKDAIEKEYWLLMLSQTRPAPKPISEPPLSRLSHFVYNAGGNTGGGDDDHRGDTAEQERQGTQGKEGGSVLARAVSDFGGTGILRRRNRLNRPTDDGPRPGLLPHLAASSVNFFSRRESRPSGPKRAVSCGMLSNGFGAAPAPAGLPTVQDGQQAQLSFSADGSGQQPELTLSPAAAASLANTANGGKAAAAAAAAAADPACQLSPDFTARIVVSGFNIEATDRFRASPRLDASPSAFSTPQAAPGAALAAGGGRVEGSNGVGGVSGALAAQLAPSSELQQQEISLLEKSRSSSLKWHQQEAPLAARSGSEAAAAGAGSASEVNLQPFRPEGDRGNVFSASNAEVDEPSGQRLPKWGFWRSEPSGREQLLPEGHSPCSPGSQHTLVIQDPVKPVQGSSPSRHFSSSTSVFASSTAQKQQEQLVASRMNSVLSRKPPSTTATVQRRSTDAVGAAGSVAASGTAASRTAVAAAAAASGAPAASLPSDPLLQPGVLEAVNLKVDGKAVDTSTIKPAEWERLRTGIALKTFTALMKKYQNLSDAEEAKKLRDARRFAKGLFYHVRGTYVRPYVVRDDFTPFFASKESADAAFGYFDKDNDATISLKEMKDSVVAIFKERKNMAASLKDTDSIVSTLEFGIGCLLHFIFAALYLLVWGMDIVKGFSTFSATVLALTFIFGNSVRQIYESMLFLFLEHAYDVGDLLEVEMVAYRVKKIDLMYTVLVKSTGERCYYPNVRLITLPVINLTRSCARSEKVVISLDVGQASNAAREALLAAVKEHYEENESDFNSCPSVNFANMVDPFKVQLSVTWTYNFGADESKRTSMVKTGLLQVVHSCLGNLRGLEYTLVKGTTGRTGITGDDDAASECAAEPRAAPPLGAGVTEQQAAKTAAMGAALMGGTTMMGASAGLAVL